MQILKLLTLTLFIVCTFTQDDSDMSAPQIPAVIPTYDVGAADTTTDNGGAVDTTTPIATSDDTTAATPADTTAAPADTSADTTSTDNTDTTQAPVDATTLPGEIDVTPSTPDQSTPAPDQTAAPAPADNTTSAPADNSTSAPAPTPAPTPAPAPAVTPIVITPPPVPVFPPVVIAPPATNASTSAPIVITPPSPPTPPTLNSSTFKLNKFKIPLIHSKSSLSRYSVFPEPIRSHAKKVITTRLPSKSVPVKHPSKAPIKITKTKTVTKKPVTKTISKPVLKNISSGNYTFTAVNTTLSPITVIINPKTLGFTGCNTFSIPYISINQGQFQIFGQVSSTQKQCKVNNDHKYLDVMRQADGYHHHQGNNFFLTRRGNRIGHFAYSHYRTPIFPSRSSFPSFGRQSVGLRRISPFSYGY